MCHEEVVLGIDLPSPLLRLEKLLLKGELSKDNLPEIKEISADFKKYAEEDKRLSEMNSTLEVLSQDETLIKI